MLNGLYSAAAGMDAAQARHETAATNLASAQQPGFRRTQVGRGTFEAAVLAVQHQEGRDAGPNQSGDLLDFREGTMQLTGRGLDLAIQGDGFFVVDGPEGLLYTRNGRFFVNEASELVTVDGLPLQGTAGPIRLPPGTSTSTTG